MDVPWLVDKAYALPEGQTLLIKVCSKNEQEALKMRIWRYLKKFKGEYDLVISMPVRPDGYYVALRKPSFEAFIVHEDGSKEPVNAKLEKLEEQMKADGISAEKIRDLLSKAKK